MQVMCCDVCSDYVKVRNALCLYGKYGSYHCAFRVKQVCTDRTVRTVLVFCCYWTL